MNNNPIGWPDSAFGYNSSTQTLTAPTVAATKTVMVNAPSTYTGNFLDFQVGGSSRINITSSANPSINTPGQLTIGTSILKLNIAYLDFLNSSGFIYLQSNGYVMFGGATRLGNDSGTLNTLAQLNGTNAQTFRIYNTYTSATNYERGKLEWASNTFRIGTEKGSGGGTARSMALQTDATDRLTLDTIGSVRVATALTVATLPGTPTVGMIARVTDASAPAVGSIVAGGGAAAALCWYNGTNWTVLGI